jgi:hypothetical protein
MGEKKQSVHVERDNFGNITNAENLNIQEARIEGSITVNAKIKNLILGMNKIWVWLFLLSAAIIITLNLYNIFKITNLDDKPVIVNQKGKKTWEAAIDEKFDQLNIAGIGLTPLTDYQKAKDGGYYRRYKTNDGLEWDIYWHPSFGAHVVLGDILKKWKSLGAENSILGYPTTDETVTPDTIGRYNHFQKGSQKGSIYWTPETGARVIYGPIRDKWRDLEWERGPLGYPISDVQKEGDTLLSRFQGGIIKLTPQGQYIVIQKSLNGLAMTNSTAIFKKEVVNSPTFKNTSFNMDGSFEPTSAFLAAEAGDQIMVCATGEPSIGTPEENNLFFSLYNKGRPLKPGRIAKIDRDYYQECATWTLKSKGNYQVLFTRKEDDSQIIVHYSMRLIKK